MEIKQLREFITLAETGNFIEAANRLYVSQSTLSRHLQALETELGLQLFTRTTRHVEINDHGRLLLPYAQKIIKTIDDYHEAAKNDKNEVENHLTIGSIPIMAQYHITTLLTDFQKVYPDICLDITEEESSNLKTLVNKGKCDFAFVRDVSHDEKDFHVIPYATDWLAAILPANHPLAHNGNIQLEQLKKDKFLLLSEGTLVHNLCMKACADVGFEPRVCYTGHRASNIIDLVAKGMGTAVLTKKSAVFYSSPFISILDIVPHVSTTINLIYSKEKILTKTNSCFLEHAKAFVKAMN